MQPKKLSNGSWQVRYRDLQKKQRARNFEKKKDAEDELIRYFKEQVNMERELEEIKLKLAS